MMESSPNCTKAAKGTTYSTHVCTATNYTASVFTDDKCEAPLMVGTGAAAVKTVTTTEFGKCLPNVATGTATYYYQISVAKFAKTVMAGSAAALAVAATLY